MSYASKKSVVFAGDPEHINLGNIHAFGRTSPFSISLWFKTTYNISTAGILISKLMASPTYTGWEVYLNADEEINFYLINDFSTGNRIRIQAESWVYGWLRDGNWHHVVVTWDGYTIGNASGANIYIDGISMRTHGRITTFDDGLTTPDSTSTANLNLARRPDGYGYYIGSIDDVTIWDKELTADEVYEIWNNHEPGDTAGTVPSPNLVGWWKMGDLDLAGVPAYSPLTTCIEANNGTTNEYIKFNENAATTFDLAEPFSFGLWVKHSTTTTQTYMAFHTDGSANAYAWLLQYNTSGVLRITRGQSVSSYWDYTSNPADGAWHHVFVTHDGTSGPLKVYVDGALVTQSGSGSGWPSAQTPQGYQGVQVAAYFYFGGPNFPLSGRVCHCAVYNKELSAAEVTEVYNNGLPPDLSSTGPTANLVLWSTLGDGCALGTGNILDLSITNNDGTYFNGDAGDFVSDVPSGIIPALRDWQTQVATTVAEGVSDYSYNTNNGTPTNMEDADFADAILASELMPDLSGNGYVGTPTNMEDADFQTDTPGGRSRRSSLFDGVNEYITMGDVLGFERTDAFSISAWIKVTGVPTTQKCIISKLVGSTTYTGWTLGVDNLGEVWFFLISDWSTDNAIGVGTGATGLFDSSWHHIAVSYNGSSTANGVNIHIDGVAMVPVIWKDGLTGSITSVANCNIGRREEGGAGNQYFPGNIDDVTIYDKELSLAEVQDIYNGGLPRDNRLLSSASNIVGYWLMGDLTAGGCSHFATRFDGVNEYVTMGNVLGFERTDPFSVSVWIKYTPNGSDMWLVSKKDTGQPGWNLGIGPTGFIKFELFNTYPTNWMQAYVAISFGDDVWHHVVATWDGDVSPGRAGANIYVDGIAQSLVGASDTLTGSIVNTTDLEIGARETGTAGNFEGVIDQVAVYARELTAIEAAALYNNGVPIDVTAAIDRTDLVGYWRMGEGDGTGVGSGYSPLTEAIFLNEGATATESLNFSPVANIDVLGKNDPFSVGLWVNYTGTATRYLCSKYTAGVNVGWYFSDLSNGTLRVRFRDGLYMDKTWSSTGINDGQWHLVVFTYNGSGVYLNSGLELYVDGVLVTGGAEGGNGTPGVMETTYGFAIGRIQSSGLYYYEGKVLHSFVYDKELSAAEISTIYGGGCPQDLSVIGPTSNLMHWCTLGDGCLNNTANGAPDLSSYGNDGYWYSTTRDVFTDVPTPFTPTLANGGVIDTDASTKSFSGDDIVHAIPSDAALDVSVDGDLLPGIVDTGWAPTIGEASIEVVMQAVDSVFGNLYTWTVPVPDFAGEHYPGPFNPTQIAIRAIKGFP